MALLNQFQQYSQGENTITNNVLLMFSSIYEIRPKYYEEFIQGLTEEGEYEVIPSFSQQVNNRSNGIIDGFIHIKPSKIIIETKINALDSIDKITKYAESFDDNDYKILFHLSQIKYPEKDIDSINEILSSKKKGQKINFQTITYQDLVDQLNELTQKYPYESQLQRLNENFKIYCLEMNLILKSHHILRAMACGQSFDLNKKFRFYFDLASRGYSRFDYLGIYKSKSVQYIGKVENVIEANWDDNKKELIILHSESEVTTEQRERLTNAIEESVEKDWYVYKDHRFFLFNEFEETNFIKDSPGGIFRVRYFNLEDYLNPVPSDLKTLAEELKNKEWE